MKDSFTPSAYVAAFMVTIVGLFALIWTYTATQRVRFLPATYGPWRAHVQMITKCDLGDVVILGSSRANAAFVPHLLGVNAVNLAMAGATPIEGYYEAKAIYRCPRPPKVAIVSFSGVDMLKNKWFWEQSARYGLLSYGDLQDVASHAKALNYPDLYRSSFGSEPPPSIKNWLYVNHFPPYDFASLLNARIGIYRRRQNFRIAAETLEQRGQHLLSEGRCAKAPAWEAQHSSFIPNLMHAFYLSQTIDFLEKRGVRVLYISTPLNPMTYVNWQGSYSHDFDAYIKLLQAAHFGLNIVTPPPLNYSLCDFSDDNHLNQAGAEKFSRSVAPLISAALNH